MRESLRGALLSVLFFALLIGGAPSMAAAVDWQSVTAASHVNRQTCTDNGGNWSGGPRDGSCLTDRDWREENCEELEDLEETGEELAMVGGLAGFLWPPAWAVAGMGVFLWANAKVGQAEFNCGGLDRGGEY